MLWQFKTRNFIVRYEIEEEAFDGRHMDMADLLEIKEKIEDGEYACFTACISVSLRTNGQELSSEYLGQCIYSNPFDFIDHRGMNQKGHGSYFSQMVREACQNAREELKKVNSIKVR